MATRKRRTSSTYGYGYPPRRRRRKSGTQIIPGVNVTVSWRRLLGITRLKRWFSKKTGIPTTEQGLYRKIGRWIVGLFTKRK